MNLDAKGPGKNKEWTGTHFSLVLQNEAIIKRRRVAFRGPFHAEAYIP